MIPGMGTGEMASLWNSILRSQKEGVSGDTGGASVY